MTGGRRPFDAVVFDFDGTLVRLTIDFDRMRREVEAVVRLHGAGECANAASPSWELVAAAEALLLSRGADGARMRAEAHAAIEAIECEAARRARPLGGARGMLARLRRIGVSTAVVTRNSGRAVRIAFPGIEEACDCFLPREAVPHVKPHPAHLARCLAILGADPGRALMVGDHPIDIRSGREAGVRTAGVLTGSGSEEALRREGAEYIFREAAEILRLFPPWGGARLEAGCGGVVCYAARRASGPPGEERTTGAG